MKSSRQHCLALVISSVILLGLARCGGGGGSNPPPPPPLPAAPTGVVATPANGQVTITWSAVSGATSYNLYWLAGAGVTTASGTKVANTTSPSVVSGLTNGTAYSFIVTAVNGGGEGNASSVVNATPTAPPPPPAAPSGLTATPADGQVTVSWSSVSGANSYNLYWSTSAGVTTATGTKAAGVTSPYPVGNLTNGTKYYFVTTAVNAAGESAVSAEASATPVATILPPTAPATLTATAGNAQVSVAWTSVGGATSYNLYWSTSAGVSAATGTKIANVTSPHVVGNLTNGTKYYFVATALNASGESPVSPEGNATPAASGTLPAAPTGLVTTSGSGQITVHWDWATDATSYNLYWLAGNTVTTATGTRVSSIAYPYTLSGLPDRTAYAFLITAVNAAGEGAPSAVATAVTNPPITSLTSGIAWPLEIALDANNVYWTSGLHGTDHKVNQVAIATKQVTTLFSSSAANGDLNGLAVDGTSVYFGQGLPNDGIYKVPIGGGASEKLITLGVQGGDCFRLAVRGSTVYFLEGTSAQVLGGLTQAIRAVSTGGGSASTLVSGLTKAYAYSLAVDGSRVYWTEGGRPSGRVASVPLGGGSATYLATGEDGPDWLAIDGTNVYWFQYGGSIIRSVPLGGGTAVTVATANASLQRNIAVDASHVYWIDGDHYSEQIRRAPLGGGAAEIVVSLPPYTGPIAIAVDGTNLYWLETGNADGQGAVKMAPK